MEWLNANYKVGKFTSGDGRFVGKEIRCQKGGSFLVHQPLFAQKIEVIPMTRERKRREIQLLQSRGDHMFKRTFGKSRMAGKRDPT